MLKGTDADNSQVISPQIVDIERLMGIITKIDFSKIKEKGETLDILIRLFPEVPREALRNIAIQANQNIKSNAQELKEHRELKARKARQKKAFYINLSLAIAGAVATLYFGGPIAVKLTDAAVTQIYTIIFGIPNPSTITYSLYAPCKHFLTYIAGKYGPYFMAITTGPSIFTLGSMVQYIGNKIHLLQRMLLTTSVDISASAFVIAKSVDEIADEFELLGISNQSQPQKEEDKWPSEMVLGGHAVELCVNYRGQKKQAPNVTVQPSELRSQASTPTYK